MDNKSSMKKEPTAKSGMADIKEKQGLLRG